MKPMSRVSWASLQRRAKVMFKLRESPLMDL